MGLVWQEPVCLCVGGRLKRAHHERSLTNHPNEVLRKFWRAFLNGEGQAHFHIEDG